MSDICFEDTWGCIRASGMKAEAVYLLGVHQLSLSDEKEGWHISLPVLNFHPEAFCS